MVKIDRLLFASNGQGVIWIHVSIRLLVGLEHQTSGDITRKNPLFSYIKLLHNCFSHINRKIFDDNLLDLFL